MAGLSKANLRKELPKGEFKGKSALSVIAHKIENQSPFELVGGGSAAAILSFNIPKKISIFKNIKNFRDPDTVFF